MLGAERLRARLAGSGLRFVPAVAGACRLKRRDQVALAVADQVGAAHAP
jgi:hypothetical protein